MKRCRNDRKNRMALLFCLLMLLWGFCQDVRAEEAAWKEYRTTATEGKLSYDLKSIVVEDNVVDVWSRFEPVADERIREMKHWVRFDCARKRMKVLETITAYHDGTTVKRPQKNKFEAIQPGSNPAALGAEVCGENTDPQAPSQEPVTAPVEKQLTEVQPLIQPAPHEPVMAPIEKPLMDIPAPVLQQATPPAETPAAAPADQPR